MFSTPVLSPHFFRSMVHLCISGAPARWNSRPWCCDGEPRWLRLPADANKAMLVQCPSLIPAVLDALFLEPDHPRKDMDESVRARIQCDGAECFLQLALFEPGKVLLVQHNEALDALRALVSGGALSEEVKLCASSALAAMEGPSGHAPTPGGEKHIMMSCMYHDELTTLRSDMCWLIRDTLDVPPDQSRVLMS
eukprot:SAG11_NODE_1128_length_5762_cov_2.633763_1_plen_194_part_00